MRNDAKVLDGVRLRWLKPLAWVMAACLLGGVLAGLDGRKELFVILSLSSVALFILIHVLTGIFGRCGICGGRVAFINLPIAPDQVDFFKSAPRQMRATPYEPRSTGWYACGYRCRSCTTLGIISLENRHK